MTNLTPQQIAEAGLTDWTGDKPLTARFDSRDFAAGLEFVNAVGAAAEQADHHPDILLTYNWVEFTLVSHDVDAVTERDVDLARKISSMAAERGLEVSQLS